MKAVRLYGYGGIDQLRYEESPTPEPGPDEILVKVIATSVNPIDFKIRSGEAKDRFPVQFPAILGRDVAGEVMKAGPNASKFNSGQKVMGMVDHAYAEFLTAKAELLTPIPDGLDAEQAGALPLVTLTGAQLAAHVEPRAGNTILVTGALGSVGRTAVYEAKRNGAKVIAGVRANQKSEAGSLGADQVIAIDDDREIASLPELDAIADTVGQKVIERLIPKLKDGGILGSVVGPPEAAKGKNIRVQAFMAKPDSEMLRRLAEAARDGKLTIPIAKKFKLSQAGEAQDLAEKGGVSGKILLIA